MVTCLSFLAIDMYKNQDDWYPSNSWNTQGRVVCSVSLPAPANRDFCVLWTFCWPCPVCLFLLLSYCWERASPYNLTWPSPCCGDQAGLTLCCHDAHSRKSVTSEAAYKIPLFASFSCCLPDIPKHIKPILNCFLGPQRKWFLLYVIACISDCFPMLECNLIAAKQIFIVHLIKFALLLLIAI